MNWQKFLDLVKRTGDRLIVTDKDAGEAYVIMSLSEYEAMISQLEGRSNAEETVFPDEGHDQGYPEFEEEPSVGEPGMSDEERFYLEPIE